MEYWLKENKSGLTVFRLTYRIYYELTVFGIFELTGFQQHIPYLDRLTELTGFAQPIPDFLRTYRIWFYSSVLI